MYPGEGMYVGDEAVQVHRHHLPNMEDDDDDDHHHHHNHNHDHDLDNNDHSSDNSHHRHQQESHQHNKHKHKHPSKGHTPPPPHRHHPTPPKGTPIPTPSLRPQQPLQPPTPLILPQPLQPPTPILPQPPLQPPILIQQPPSSPPRKPQPPPPMDLNHPHPHHYNDDYLDDDKHKPPNQQVIAATVFILLLLLGLTFLILWLIYRPSKPHFSAVSTLIYTLNTTSAVTTTAGATVAASMQFIIHTTNPNKRTTLSYDHLTATVYYRSTAITPPVPLPPLFHRKHSSVIIAPVIGGPPPAVEVPVGWEVANGLLSEEAYGVVGFSWVVVGRVRYRVGGFKSGHSRVYVKCDVVVKLTGVNNGVYVNSAGQVPLLSSPPCLVDI